MKSYLNERKYFEAVQISFGDPKEPVQFDESTPVSVELIRPLFGICSVVMVIGVVRLVVESWKGAKLWGARVVGGLTSFGTMC